MSTNLILVALIIDILPMIKMQESRGNPNPGIGKHGEIGPYQIRQCVIDDVNTVYGTHYTLADAKNEFKAQGIAFAYLYHWGNKKNVTTLKELCRIWNGGPNGNKVRDTIVYWEQIKTREKLKG